MRRASARYCLKAKTLPALFWRVPSTSQLSEAKLNRHCGLAFAEGRGSEFHSARSTTWCFKPRCDSRQRSDLPTATASKCRPKPSLSTRLSAHSLRPIRHYNWSPNSCRVALLGGWPHAQRCGWRHRLFHGSAWQPYSSVLKLMLEASGLDWRVPTAHWGYCGVWYMGGHQHLCALVLLCKSNFLWSHALFWRRGRPPPVLTCQGPRGQFWLWEAEATTRPYRAEQASCIGAAWP